VQRKYLGERFELDSIIELYENLDKQDILNRKLWVERLAEMSWQENRDNRVKALEICYAFWKEQGNVQMLNNLEFDVFRAKAMLDPVLPEDLNSYYRPEETYMMLSNKKVYWSLPLSELDELNLPYKKITELDDDNVCDDIHYQLIFETFVLKVYYESKPDNAFIYTMDLSAEGNAFVVNNFKIDKHTTERDFLTNLGRVTRVFYDNPHTYYINVGEASFITLIFKDGKASSFEELFYC